MAKPEKYEFIGELSDDYVIEIAHSSHGGFRRFLNKFKGKRLIVSIEEYQKNRSLAQNRWLFGVAYVMVRAFLKETTGEVHTSDEIHAYTLNKILGYKPVIKIVNGMEVIVMEGQRTSTMTTKEFGEMKDLLQAHWAERGCVIPDPHQDNFITDFLD